MATGGFPRLKQSKSETKQRSSNWPRSVSSDKDDSLSLTSFPSDIRINNWDLSDLRPTASADSRRRKKSKGNPEREREQSLSMDSPPHGEPKQRTPTSLSRTRNTPTAQRDALEKLKQKLTYDEEQCSSDGERNNERSQARSRRRQANNREADGARGGGSGSRRSRSNRNNNTEHGPDRNQIVGRLVQIQDYIKQATSMMETLQKSGDSGNAEDLAKVGRLISNLQEQEQGYLSLLHANAVARSEMSEAGNDGLPVSGAAKEESDSDDVDLEVESNASETTETSSSSRPRIEDKLGLGSEDEENEEDEEEGSDDSKDEDTAMDNTLITPAEDLAQAVAMRNVADTLNSLTGEREGAAAAAAAATELSSAQRQQLMRVMMEKQEQLRQLQGRQDKLLSMKKEAEQRLQQAQARDNQARAALAQVQAGQRVLEEEGAFLEQTEVQLKSNIVPYPESDDDETSNAREMDPLSELQRQLNFLRNEFSAESELRPRNNTEGSSGGGSASGGASGVTTALNQQQQQLEVKLKDLQQKKRGMDQLLAQLETLRSQRLQVMNNEPTSGRPQPSPQQQQQQPSLQLPPALQLPQAPTSVSPSLQPPSASQAQAQAPRTQAVGGLGDLTGGQRGLSSLGSLSELMNMMGGGEGGALSGWQVSLEEAVDSPSLSMQDAQDKLEKLQEVRQRLNQLRDLVQYYQKMKTQPIPEGDGQSDAATGSELLSGRPLPMEESQLLSLPLSALVSGNNMSAMPSAPLQGAMASAASDEQSNEDNASASEDWESGMGPWDGDPEVQEKVRKLMKAKDKLRDLQGLIAAIESMPEGEKVADMSQNSSSSMAPRPIRGGGQQARSAEVLQPTEEIGDGGAASASEGEVPSNIPLDSASSNPMNDPRIQMQMEELSRLRDERHRLLSLQQQLHTLQDKFVEVERDSETERRPESSPQKEEERMQPPSTSVVTFASNDELYSKMRDQRIEREELRSKKKELEAIMKKDPNRRQYFRNQDNHSDTVSYTTNTDAFGANASADATMATWGGSTVDNLENITEDEDGQDNNTRADEEDDGYPSDGIIQVEEEEEENETDNGTYTISSDARQRMGSQLVRGETQGQGARPKTTKGRRGFPQPIKPPGGKKGGKRLQSQPWGRVARGEKPQHKQSQNGSQTSADGAMDDVALTQFQQQLEKMSSLCQNLMGSPSSSGGQTQSKTRSQLATVPQGAPSPPNQSDIQAQLMREMQQQQLMMAVSQCNQQLMMQQFDMAALHRQLQQLTGQMTALQLQPPSSSGGAGTTPAALLAGNTGGPPNNYHPAGAQQGVLIPQPYLSPLSSTLAAHVPNNMATSVNVQSSRQTTFTVNPNFTSNPFSSAAPADPQRFPVSQAVQTTTLDCQEPDPEGWTESGPGTTFPRPMRLWEDAEQPVGSQSQASETLPKMNLQAFLKARRKKNSRRRSAEKSQKSSEDKERGAAYRPGLSAGISGAGFDDAASVSSLASSQQDGAVGGQASQAEEPGALGELNLFEELRETIYTEVATLISQNESRPQYLLDLFTQLQCLNTDVMRRRCLFTLQDIVQTSYVKPVSGNASESRFMTMWSSRDDQDNITTELTPSESMPTSDDEDIKARVRQHASALERKKHKQHGWGLARGNSLKDDKFDYVEKAVTTSSLSTPTNDNGEPPFSRDSLGDTVIHLDKALAKMKREMQQAEQERAERARNAMAMEMKQEAADDAAAGDQGSESSVSDLPYPSIDAMKLDEQIKGVMGKVIPVIKEHINDVFSPQLLSYIQRLVLSLVRQPGQNHEFARFFYGQLGSNLHESLSKFEGRRVREVGEDVLMDMSEELFNELAFLGIMRDLDNPIAMEKMRKHSWFSSLGSQGTSATMIGEDYDAGGNESDNEASDDKDDDDDDDRLPNLKVNGMDEEEEDLGKERDDELARKMVTQAGDERDEDMEDLGSSSEVHIQLAMSETKPFTRIGSDEDTEGSDESLSLEDPSDTAVSHMMEHRQDLTTSQSATSLTGGAATFTASPGSASAASPRTAPNASPQPKKEATTEREEEKEADTSEADGTLETRGQADGSRSNSSAAAVAANSDMAAGGDQEEDTREGKDKGEAMQVNGYAGENGEEEEETVGLDDLPPVLSVTNPETVNQQRQEEDMATSGVCGIINSMDTGFELAGDGMALKEPPDSSGK